ncbi:MAG: flagellar motor switch protein FliN [Campylobacterales bacterium]|nr:flagellar motor switch protein FliN [Campylobacterales bacterium]
MNDFIELLKGEISATINGLIGVEPEVDIQGTSDLGDGSSSPAPMTKLDVGVSGDFDANVSVLVPPSLATALSDMMLGGEGESREEMEEDDIDAIKEVISNIVGSISNVLNSQKDLPKLNFTVDDASFISDGEVDTSDFSQMATFDFRINAVENVMMFCFDSGFVNGVENPGNSGEEEEEGGIEATGSGMPSIGGGGVPAAAMGGAPVANDVSSEEMRNISLLMDVKLTLRVRIGQKKMLLRDVIGMDIGSIVELDQLANEPLDILVDNKKIAEGEVVIVDGNFGIQITSIGSKRDRLEQLKG